MSQRISPPEIDARKASDLLRQLRGLAPHYTKEWPAKDDADPGVALLKIFSFIAEGVIGRLNRAPERNFLAFLDMLGIRLLPATPARVPVRFLVAKGTKDPFSVATGTQVSAVASPPERPTELPFETIKPLLVIPAALAAMFAVDPLEDHIYRAPPGFLELATAATELPALNVTAFSSAGSRFLQLDPPDQVAEGDFLRIEQVLSQDAGARGCVPVADPEQLRAIDHLIVSAPPKGPIVTVRDPLPRDYAEGTQVQKVTRFELFEGKNWQEHILFLGHDDYFAIKSEAEITLLVEHAPGASTDLPAFKVVWEFFGVTETNKEEGWHEFKVELDATQGFSRDGEVVLIKPAGEIKQKEINGAESRWIRARLDGALPAAPPPLLPKIESITLKVSSGGKSLPADQAFHNDTPLTASLKFFPFGTEPRIFDRFSVASEEAFSKHGAEVTLELQLDFTDLLASPAAIFKAGEIRAFAHGAAGRLVEFQINPVTSSFEVVSHKTPTDRRLVGALTPAVVEDAAKKNVGVFVRADDGRIHLRHIPDENTANWFELKPIEPQLDLAFEPAAVLAGSQWAVYVVADNRVFRTAVNPVSPDPAAAVWVEVTSPNPQLRPVAASRPALLEVTVGGDKVVWVAVTDQDGHTWVHDGTTWRDLWAEIPSPAGSFLAKKNARPEMVRYSIPDPNPGSPPNSLLDQARIFLRGANDQLLVLNTEPKDPNNQPFSLGAPPGGMDSNPFVFPKEGNHRVYVRGTDNQLWVLDVATDAWVQLTNSLDAALAGDPFVLGYNVVDPNAAPDVAGDVISVLSTSNKNLLLEFRSRGQDVESGNLEAGPDQILLLDDALVGPAQQHFVHITSGAGANSDEDATRQIRDAEGEFAILEKPLSEIPRSNTRYELFRQKEADLVAADATVDDEVQLKPGTIAQQNDFIFVRGQLRQIESLTNDTAKVDADWDTLPEEDDPYVVLTRIDSSEKAAEGSARRVVLEDGLPPPPSGTYVGLFIEIGFGPGEVPVTRKITNYISAIRGVVLDDDLPAAPPPNTTYTITVGTLAEGWQSYRDPDQTELRPELSWEYWNGKGFVHLPVKDSTENFLVPGNVIFTVPENIEKTEVAGQENYWIRARIVGGDYGRELFTVEDNKIKIIKDPIRPPLVKQLSISYKLTELKPPQFCLTYNNLSFLDQTAANVTPDKHFKPYFPLPDTGKAVYFGFDRTFKGGPVKIYFAAKELEVDERNRPRLDWEFAFDNDWSDIFAEDDTDAFTKPEFVSLNVPEGFQNRLQFGQALFWLRATLVSGGWTASPLLAGAFINTVEALQARTVLDEILGSSTGEKNQRFRFQLPVIEGGESEQFRSRRLPVLEGEEVRVREVLTEQEREQLVAERGEDAVLAARDQQGRVIETWVRWTEVLEFFNSEPGSRHYRLDRATGEIEFGDGVRGRIPPAGGDNVRAFAYQAGGGAAGNVRPGEITSAVTAVAGVDSVVNPVAGGGGSEAATNADMLVIGPEQISNRGRAVTPGDFEQLAREASREVRKALCLPNRNAAGRHESGWASVYIVPDSQDAAPVPSLELRRAVERYLFERADVALVDQGHIFVGAPEYVPVSVDVTVFARSLDLVAAAEQSVRKKLEQFLHPLTGGHAGEGWDFGRDLAASDLYALLEDIDEVDHVGPLRLVFGDRESEERVEVGASALIASGTHKITTNVETGD